jgi:3-oxoisoapionate kinase
MAHFATTGVPQFSVGSSGVESALGAFWQEQGRLEPAEAWPKPGAAEPLLVISGSCSPVTAGQISWALEHGFAGVACDVRSGLQPDAVVKQAVTALDAGRSVVIYTNRGEKTAALLPAETLGATLGQIARAVLDRVKIKRLIVAGGDTSSYAARALGLEAIEMIAPLAPGSPLCRAHAPGSPADGLEINFKGGQVGTENYFGHAAHPELS